mmetsp:Transcript_21191/g.71224  ORF Transcript_21191/g.71224 Transcript_21191/m.71224 type:complete len:559 (+) Transcript_21191:452-2128(+)
MKVQTRVRARFLSEANGASSAAVVDARAGVVDGCSAGAWAGAQCLAEQQSAAGARAGCVQRVVPHRRGRSPARMVREGHVRHGGLLRHRVGELHALHIPLARHGLADLAAARAVPTAAHGAGRPAQGAAILRPGECVGRVKIGLPRGGLPPGGLRGASHPDPLVGVAPAGDHEARGLGGLEVEVDVGGGAEVDELALGHRVLREGGGERALDLHLSEKEVEESGHVAKHVAEPGHLHLVAGKEAADRHGLAVGGARSREALGGAGHHPVRVRRLPAEHDEVEGLRPVEVQLHLWREVVHALGHQGHEDPVRGHLQVLHERTGHLRARLVRAALDGQEAEQGREVPKGVPELLDLGLVARAEGGEGVGLSGAVPAPENEGAVVVVAAGLGAANEAARRTTRGRRCLPGVPVGVLAGAEGPRGDAHPLVRPVAAHLHDAHLLELGELDADVGRDGLDRVEEAALGHRVVRDVLRWLLAVDDLADLLALLEVEDEAHKVLKDRAEELRLGLVPDDLLGARVPDVAPAGARGDVRREHAHPDGWPAWRAAPELHKARGRGGV